MEKNKMKKLIFLSLIFYVLSLSLYAIPIKIVNTTYEDELLESIRIEDKSFVTTEEWYFSKDGIDKTAEKMVEKLPESEPVILYGISLGGTVSRRMTQIAKENGRTVKGYIAQSSPLSGDRLTNTSWATKSLVMLGGYALISLDTLFFGLPIEQIFQRDSSYEAYDLWTQLDDKSKSIVTNFENTRNNKRIDRNDSQSIIENATLPLLDLVLGNDENSRNGLDYFTSVFTKDRNNVKDLDPVGSFMVNVMNNEQSMENEAVDEIKRAFIVSKNGNVYETSIWKTVGPVMKFYQNQRDSYWAKANNQWYLFAYWSLRAAASSISVATIEEFPRVWSFCVSGSRDYSTNDGFVPANDTFKGKKLQMIAPNMRDYKFDRSYECDKVSHIDYAQEHIDYLNNIQGRTYSRALSLEQQQKKLIEAYNFVTLNN